MKIDKKRAADEIGDRGWLALLPAPVRAEILERSILTRVSAGQAVFHAGDPAGGIYGLVAGAVSISLAPAGANPRTVLLGRPGHWTGEACFLTRMPRRGELRAIVDTTLLHLPLDSIDQMAARDPQMVHHVALILVMSVDFLLRVIHDLQKPDPHRRIASVLERTSWIGDMPIPLSQSELGTIANASRKQVNAAIRRFAQAGWVAAGYRSITVTDAEALRRYAEGED